MANERSTLARVVTNILFTISFAFRSLFRKGNFIFTVLCTVLVIGSVFVKPSLTYSFITTFFPIALLLTGVRNLANSIGNRKCDKEKLYFFHGIQSAAFWPLILIIASWIFNIFVPRRENHLMAWTFWIFVVCTIIAMIIYIAADTYDAYCFVNDDIYRTMSAGQPMPGTDNTNSTQQASGNQTNQAYGVYEDQNQSAYNNKQYEQYGYQQNPYQQNPYSQAYSQEDQYAYSNNQYGYGNGYSEDQYSYDNNYRYEDERAQYGYEEGRSQDNYGNNDYSGYGANSASQESSAFDEKEEERKALYGLIKKQYEACKTLDELKAKKRGLIKNFHPDNAEGDDIASSVINELYDKYKEMLSNNN